jgi:uncharacterized protein
MLTRQLIQAVLEGYALHPNGIHGISHWARVLENGRLLAPRTGANLEVVELFAVLHDSKRLHDGGDREHGRRGADFARQLRGDLFNLDDTAFDLLYTACAQHTDGLIVGDITLQTCWDADRLDLLRAGVPPLPGRLCTPAARRGKVIAWASRRSLLRKCPALVQEEWGLA